jgi:hypothetical protein
MKAKIQQENKKSTAVGEADSLRDKGAKAQRHKAEKPFSFVSLSPCSFVPLHLCA